MPDNFSKTSFFVPRSGNEVTLLVMKSRYFIVYKYIPSECGFSLNLKKK